jgi:hypothetical protein
MDLVAPKISTKGTKRKRKRWVGRNVLVSARRDGCNTRHDWLSLCIGDTIGK